MKLFLLRHAKSNWDPPFQVDFERGLSTRGEKNCILLHEYLQSSEIFFDCILASPSKRTKLTLEKAIPKSAHRSKPMFEESLYESSAIEAISLLQKLEPQFKRVLIVGHNPSLSELSQVLLQNSAIEDIPTLGFVGLTNSTNTWEDFLKSPCKLEVFWRPRFKHEIG